jgi:flagellar motility protein MotE (MotC chaperone)
VSEPWNYFNYFTEIEEHFQRARGTGLFLMSPLDWALIESWKNAGVPLEAVLRGIDAAFIKWHARKKRLQQVNSVAYCTQAVFAEAQIMAGGTPAAAQKHVEAPFTLEELRAYLATNASGLRGRGEAYSEIAAALDKLHADSEAHYSDLEQLEQRLTALEDKMSAIARSTQSEEDLFAARRDLDSTLRPYRGKMTADQLAMLERQYLDRRLLEAAQLPRLSLFYLR